VSNGSEYGVMDGDFDAIWSSREPRSGVAHDDCPRGTQQLGDVICGIEEFWL